MGPMLAMPAAVRPVGRHMLQAPVNLYRLARFAATAAALASMRPGRIARRANNVVVGRTLARLGAWRWLWR